MEARGYFERKPDPDDRRASLVVTTDRGREQIRVARRLIAGTGDLEDHSFGHRLDDLLDEVNATR